MTTSKILCIELVKYGYNLHSVTVDQNHELIFFFFQVTDGGAHTTAEEDRLALGRR